LEKQQVGNITTANFCKHIFLAKLMGFGIWVVCCIVSSKVSQTFCRMMNAHCGFLVLPEEEAPHIVFT